MNIICPICNNISDNILFSSISNINLHTYKCNICRCYFAGLTSNEREIANTIYQKHYWDNESKDLDNQNEQVKINQLLNQLRYCELEYNKQLLSILEIGSGLGYSTRYLTSLGHNVISIEPDINIVNNMNNNTEHAYFINGYAETASLYDIESRKYNIVWLSHSLEHVYNPNLVLENIKKHLVNGSKIFIEVPNCESDITLDSSIFDNPSTFHYNLYGLSILLNRHSFTILKSDRFMTASKFDRVIYKHLPITIRDKLYRYYPYVKGSNNHNNNNIIRILGEYKL